MGDKGALLGREHLLAAEFAGEEGRYQYAVLNVKADGTAEATNGHYAIRVPPSRMPVAEFPEVQGMGGAVNGNGLLIPTATCRETVKALKRSSIPVLETAHVGAGATEGTAVVTTTDLETMNPRTVKVAGGTFPDLDKVIPTDDTDRIVIGMNAHYLKRIADYAIKVNGGRRNPIVALSVGKPDGPVRFDVTLGDGDRKATIVLMPARL